MKTSMLRILMVLCLLVPLAAVPVPAQAAIGGQLYGTGGDITVEVLYADAGYTSHLYLFSPVFRDIGTNREVGKVVTLTGIPAGEELVFGIVVQNTGNTFKMGPGSRNPDGLPHADVNQTGERMFDVGFEDLFGGGDRDYNDNMFRFTGALAPVPVDNTPPTITGAPDRQPNVYGWYNAPVTVSFTCADAMSGVESCSGPTTLGEGAGQSVTGTAVDKAGNNAPATVSGINVDMTPPVISFSTFPGDVNEWNNAPVGVHFTCSDALSGVATCPGDITLTEMEQHANVTATDKAGNSATITVAARVDQTPPVITGSPDRAPNAAGWYNAPVTVTFSCADGYSGIASCSGPAIVYEGANQSVTGTAVDVAGNMALFTVGGLNVDQTAPVVAYSGNAGSYTVDQMISITCSASDNLSGVAASTCANVAGAAWDFALGTHTFSAAATDFAGNTGGATASFTVGVTEESLCRLVTAWSSKDGVTNSLCAKLRGAAKATTAQARSGLLAAFVNEVEAQSGKAIMPDKAAMLIQLAGQL